MNMKNSNIRKYLIGLACLLLVIVVGVFGIRTYTRNYGFSEEDQEGETMILIDEQPASGNAEENEKEIAEENNQKEQSESPEMESSEFIPIEEEQEAETGSDISSGETDQEASYGNSDDIPLAPDELPIIPAS